LNPITMSNNSVIRLEKVGKRYRIGRGRKQNMNIMFGWDETTGLA